MTNRDKKFLVIICALVAALAVVLVGIFVYFGDGEEDENRPINSGNGIVISQSESSGNAEETEKPETPGKIDSDILTEGAEIETPCGTVFYPGEWEEYLRTETVEKDGGKSIRFYAEINGKEKVHLFNYNFGIAEGNRLGTVKCGENRTELYFEIFEPEFSGNWTEDEKNDVYSMQEGFNNISAQLDIDTSTSPAVEPSSKKLKTDTPYGEISFPGEWEEYLYTEIDNTGDYTVKFYADIAGRRFALFDIIFGEKSDSSFGKVAAKDGKEAWVNVVIHDVTLYENVTSEDEDIIYGMQEAFNDIVSDIIG